jgi:two-component system LytT family sensor kinase
MKGKIGVNNSLFSFIEFEKARKWQRLLLIAILHIGGWCLLFFLPLLFYPIRISDPRFITRELLDKAILVGLFYFNYYILIPKLFERKKYSWYFLLLGGLFVIYLTIHITIRVNYIPRPNGPFPFVQAIQDTGTIKSNDLRGSRMLAFDGKIISIRNNGDRMGPGIAMREPGFLGVPKGVWAFSLNNAFSSFALMMLIGGFIRLAHSFIRNQNEKKALENANLNAEVNFLKSQINPHFLFNTLNGIYSQAHARSENTEHSILKLSDLLRYVLYESGEDKVDLSKDIQYLNNYIDLQKLRLSQKVRIRYSVQGTVEGKKIAPLLLITFVENAFKHGISYNKPSTIDISISIFEQTLTMMVSNPVVESNRFATGGLGLKNVTRRLELLYPGRHWLDVIHNDSLHIANLKIILSGD